MVILVRQHHGALYFLGQELEESTSLRGLRDTYPASDVEVVFRRQGLLIARVGTPSAPAGREPRHPEFDVIDLQVPPHERIHP